GSRITSENDEIASEVKQFEDTFFGIFVDCLKRTCAVRHACIVPKIYVVVLGQYTMYLLEYGQTTVSGIKYANRSRSIIVLFECTVHLYCKDEIYFLTVMRIFEDIRKKCLLNTVLVTPCYNFS